jgi:hypothetical protein
MKRLLVAALLVGLVATAAACGGSSSGGGKTKIDVKIGGGVTTTTTVDFKVTGYSGTVLSLTDTDQSNQLQLTNGMRILDGAHQPVATLAADATLAPGQSVNMPVSGQLQSGQTYYLDYTGSGQPSLRELFICP